MKKYLLPLILILLLTFTLIGNCAWLSGYDQRIKLTIDNTKIDGTSQYPTAQSDTYVKSTTKVDANHWAYYATDPTKSLIGSQSSNAWLSSNGSVTNQRFHIDLGSAKIIKKIYYENMHATGTNTDMGVQNFTFWGSNTGAGTFDDLVYANDEGWTQLTISQSTLDEHTASDVADPKYITVTNTTAYRYYGFKFADNHGHADYIGVRRIELQTSLSNFPITVFFTSTQAEEIFTEFDADEDFDRGQFALGDDTLLKAEKELFDDSEQKAIYHVKVTSIPINADTDIYYYYDNDADHNTSYIGIIGSATAAEVWDEWFSLVVHGVDNTTSSVLDSTSNNNDTTKKAANEPVEIAGKISKGQDFDGVDDYIACGDINALDTANEVTYEVVCKADDWDTTYLRMINKADTTGAGDRTVDFTLYDTDKSIIFYAGGTGLTSNNAEVAVATWYHLVGTAKMDIGAGSDEQELFKNGVSIKSRTDQTLAPVDSADHQLYIGSFDPTLLDTREFDGIIDEVRISITRRADAWIKATYNTLYDTLLTYGSEETSEEDNAVFFGTNV